MKVIPISRKQPLRLVDLCVIHFHDGYIIFVMSADINKKPADLAHSECKALFICRAIAEFNSDEFNLKLPMQ